MKKTNTALDTTVLSSSGFSLVELMVVVAIIGVLASVAVPNFQKYQARARQTEAKVQLASIFSMEKAFTMDQNSYSSCLSNLGFQQNARGKAYYTIGFSAATASGGSCGPDGQQACAHTSWPVSGTTGCTGTNSAGTAITGTGEGTSYFISTAKVGAVPAPSEGDLNPTALTNNTFTAAAKGFIYSTNADVWTINQDKVLSNTVNGLN
jgi:type IV pilus assembly protein PilA